MAWGLFGAKPLLWQVLTYSQWTAWEYIVNIVENSEPEFDDIV